MAKRIKLTKEVRDKEGWKVVDMEIFVKSNNEKYFQEEEFLDDEYESENILKCVVCEKEVEEEGEYSCLFINDVNKSEEEVVCCSKKCWEEYILREAEKIRFDRGISKV